jgi:DNA-binding transcriptional regulator GbsR (MarR family)
MLNCMTQDERTEPMGSPEELEFVEEVALGFERQGLFRMAGRVIGWLLICDPPEQTFNQLVEVLGASKGSISSAMKFLTPSGWVERVSHPGDRKTYYRFRPGSLIEATRAQSEHYGEFKRVIEGGLELLSDRPERRERLEAVYDLYGWLEKEIPALLQRWEQVQRDRG